ncbi:MAG: c-type cytochrome [Vicinamibacterales bacterium]
MKNVATRVLVAVAGVFIALAIGRASQTRASQPPGPQLTREAIFEYQNKQEGGGSPDAGRPIFDKLCAACHRFGEIGKDVGPDLTTIASRFKKKDVLEAILWPSKIISDQYQSEMFELDDKTIVTGVIVRETPAAVLVRTSDNPDKPVVLQKARITTRAASTVSLMPEGVLEGYSQEDIANLLAFVLAPPPAK